MLLLLQVAQRIIVAVFQRRLLASGQIAILLPLQEFEVYHPSDFTVEIRYHNTGFFDFKA